MVELNKACDEARKYAEGLLSNELPSDRCYHSVIHTHDVVDAAKEIGQNSSFTQDEILMIEIAAWFHDLGYIDSHNEHEMRGAQLAEEFLTARSISQDSIDKIKGAILATKMPQHPKDTFESALCDADLLHLASDQYLEKANLLKKELELTQEKKFSNLEWLNLNKEFLKGHSFFTPYAQENYGTKSNENLKRVKNKLKKMKSDKSEVAELQAKIQKLKEKVEKAKDNTPTRGIETMFRLTSKNHLDLSSMADSKANIMISVNSIILSVIISLLIRKLEEYPHLTIPAIIFTVVCLTTIVFAILATRPNVSKGTFTQEDILSKKTNLLFFGNFHKMEMKEYEWGMKEMMKDADYLYTSLIRDIYFLGVVLGKKYRLLRISYTIFMFGFVLSVIAFAIAEMFFRAPAPY